MGCEKCHYHGACVDQNGQRYETIDGVSNDNLQCECYHWYAGATCQYNLKVLLVGLIAIGGILFALLIICLILTCWKRNRPNRRHPLVPGINTLPHKTLTCHGQGKMSNLSAHASSKGDKRAMIEDTCSETSDDSCQLPYVTRKVRGKKNLKYLSKSRCKCIELYSRTKDKMATMDKVKINDNQLPNQHRHRQKVWHHCHQIRHHQIYEIQKQIDK